MRRILLHSLFWSVFFAYDILLTYTWMNSGLSHMPEKTVLLMAVKTVLALLPVDFLLVYYLILIAAKRILVENRRQWLTLIEMLFVFLLSVVLFRVCSYYFINPLIYHMPGTGSLMEARSIFIAILELGYVGGIAFAIKLYRLQLKAKEREKNLVKEKLETELKFLRNQTNPHFLFNTLNNIYALARKDSKHTAEVVMKLSELLSFMLYESRKPRVTVRQEIKIIEDYIDLQKLRFNDRLSIKIQKKIDDGSQQIAPLLLLPLIENAFKHGAGEARFDSFIHTSISLEKEVFEFCIENSIEEKVEKPEASHIGLANIRRQLELMYKNHSIHTQHLGNLFKVQIQIHLDSYGKV
jgi:two-component system LytT family sensor kinase